MTAATIMPISVELHLQFIRKCKRGTKYQRTCYYFIQQINQTLAMLGIKERLLQNPRNWDEIRRITDTMSLERTPAAALMCFLELAILKIAPNLATLVNAGHKSMRITTRKRTTNIVAVLVCVHSLAHYNYKKHTANDLEIEFELIVSLTKTARIKGSWRDVLKEVFSYILLMKEAAENDD